MKELAYIKLFVKVPEMLKIKYDEFCDTIPKDMTLDDEYQYFKDYPFKATMC